VVFCGYGWVGHRIGGALAAHGIRLLVVEQDRHRVDDVRQQGVEALQGDAADEQLLGRMNLPLERGAHAETPVPSKAVA
jgi:CPA2 family monovalent cation:H+ antiporter-2